VGLLRAQRGDALVELERVAREREVAAVGVHHLAKLAQELAVDAEVAVGARQFVETLDVAAHRVPEGC
jgi:hypothetical protein